MSILEITTGDLFVFRVIKYLAANPANKWVNSYEFAATDESDVTVPILLAGIIVDFEAALHSALVSFDHVTASTWTADSVPYDPTSFLSIPLTQVGLRPALGPELVPLGMALRVNRVPVSGRFGNLFYRGCLSESETSSPAGLPILTSAAGIQTLIDSAMTDSGLSAYVEDAGLGKMKMSMIDATGTTIRQVTQLVASGVSLIKQDHQWYNRTP
jgi:hypothetical protein